MPLSADHQHLLERAIHAAKLAGERIMSYYGADIEIASKGIGTHTGDVVTKADHEAQEIIFENLLQDREKDPLLADIAVLAEEMPDYSTSKRFEKPYTFVIDPLDGTRGFLDHNNSFAVSIGLIARDGTPVFGVAFLPGMGQCFVGIHGEEASVNGVPLEQPDLDSGQLVLFLSEAEIFPAEKNRVWHKVCERIKATTPIKKIRPQVIGSPVHKGCCTAESEIPALYLGLPRASKGVSLWDMTGIAPIVTGMGGWVSDVAGNPMEFNRKESIYAHHRGFLYTTHQEIAQAVIEAMADEPTY